MAARITGLNGAVYMGSTPTKITDTYDWSFTPTTELLEVRIKGDIYKRYVPDVTGAVFHAKRRNQASALLSNLVQDAGVNDTQALFRLDLIDSSGSYTQITGQGFVSGGSLTAPFNEAVGDELEITFDGAYVIT